MIKKLITVFVLLQISLMISGYTKPDTYKIDAAKNAQIHNNLGLQAVSDENYYTAIQEFHIAIALNPRTQATAVYYNNLGEVYMKIGHHKDAQYCFEKSLTQYNLNFLYYQNLVKSFKAQNLVKSKIKYYEQRQEKSKLSMIMLGLLYIENGETKKGIIKLDEFCMSEPDLLITNAVRSYLADIVPKY